MADRTPYPCRVVTPEGIAFEGDVMLTHVTGVGGDIGALAKHAPLVADLRMGHVRLQTGEDEWVNLASREGFVKVHDSTALVLVEEAYRHEDITVELAQNIIVRGQADLQSAKEKSEAAAKVERAKATDLEADDDTDVYNADVETAEQRVAWGEHLLAITQTD